MDLQLKGKAVVVTGGATGIGLATAQEFLREGCQVAICGRSPDKLDKAVAECRALGFDVMARSVDVTDSAALQAFADEVVARFGTVDVWLNNAGMSNNKPFLDFSEQEWDELMNLNLKAVFRGCQIAARIMIAHRHGGVILNAASFQSVMPAAGAAPYGASKAGVVSLSQVIAAELASHGIRVLSYIPGVIATPMAEQWMIETHQLQNIPSTRFGRPQDLANAIVFLASERASYINGVHVDVTGGKFCVQNPRYSFG
jgi:NAD(P)-dependent dehydrogenase (short-subunit alcohol dehydrogenase family)